VSTPRDRQHVVVIHRWVGTVADYATALDHVATRVSYVVPHAGRASFPAELAHDVEYVTTSGHPIATDADAATYLRAVRALEQRVGPVDRLVALHEGDLLAAAAVREALHLPGARTADVEPFRDKVVMAQRVTGEGLAVPATEAVTGHGQLRDFGDRHGWPVFVKARAGTGSAAAARLDGPADVAAVPLHDDEERVVQPYVPGDVLHVDGVWTGDRLGAWRASAYVGTCYGFGRGDRGDVLGSVEIDDPRVLAAVARATATALARLTTSATVFHLELIARDGDPTDLVFLEAAARVGGAEIPYLWRDVHGLDLVAAAVHLQLGGTADDLPGSTPADQVAGWLIVPPTAPPPCRVVARDSQLTHPAVVAEVLPTVGTAIPDVGGYELTGARFRLRGRTSQEVRDAVEEIARGFTLVTEPLDADAAQETVVVLGSGAHLYREYGFRALHARRARVVLLDTQELTWQRRWLDAYHLIDREDPAAALRLARSVVEAAPGPVAVLTWDETLVELAAEITRACGLPGIAPQAVRRCRDKLAMRATLAAAGVSPVRTAHVTTVDEARAAVAAIGLPVVLKPRSLAASVGVVRVDRPADVAAAFEQASGADYPGLLTREGVLVEELLDGPEISVDCLVHRGHVVAANVARKHLGPAPFFEEVGHRVEPWSHEPWWPATQELLQDVHRELGVDHGVTHVELRLTTSGPRVVEVNCRLGGDLIPYLGLLANGADLVGAALDLAFDRAPAPVVESGRCAEVSFVYPDADCVVEDVDVADARRAAGVSDVLVVTRPGAVLRLPPRGIVPRAAAVLVVAATPSESAQRVSEAAARVRVTGTPTGAGTTPAPDADRVLVPAAARTP